MRQIIGVALFGVLFNGVVGLAQDYPHAFPREGAVKLFENERVLIWEVVWPDGVPQPYHRHRYDMTGVFLRWGPLRVTRLDGTFTVSEDPFEIPWVFFQAKGVTHKEEGIGTPERHSIMIDMKDQVGPPAVTRSDVPPAFPHAGAEQELDSPRTLVWDVQWQPGQELPRHVHPTDTVVVVLEGGTIRSSREDGIVEEIEYAHKDIAFFPAGTTHAIRVESGSPRFMEYELKN